MDASTETLDIAGGVLSSMATQKKDGQDEPAPFASAPAPAPAPSAPAGRNTFDVFSRGSADAPPATQPSAAVETPTMDSIQSSAPVGNSAFANPLQLGQYNVPSTAYALSAEDQAELDGFEKKAQGISLTVFIVAALVVAGLAGGLGFLSSKALQERKLVNMSVEASQQAQENVGKAITEVEPLLAVVEGMKPGVISWTSSRIHHKFPKSCPSSMHQDFCTLVFPCPRH